MEKKPYKPIPVPVPKPTPKPPMRPSHPLPPMQPYPCIPCDEKLIQQLYHHLKMCHRHEMEIIHMMRRYCMKRSRRKHCHSPSRGRWDSPHWDSPHCDSSHHFGHNPYHNYESPQHNHPYDSSSFRN